MPPSKIYNMVVDKLNDTINTLEDKNKGFSLLKYTPTVRTARIEYLKLLRENLKKHDNNVKGMVNCLKDWNDLIEETLSRGTIIREFFEGRRTWAIGQGCAIPGKTSIFDEIAIRSAIFTPVDKKYSTTIEESYSPTIEKSYSATVGESFIEKNCSSELFLEEFIEKQERSSSDTGMRYNPIDI
ncbi:hypothetical protein [Piscirickettsia salmonis]|uniref:hypothetical protein n=1 Tax=Piscirickettsia salmonis TaxID=1238 RepID=UPI0007C9258A|nr:hypothetical protein A0O36_02831 [Piscirickettsiaceae bacterium NZ-RLO1]